MRFVLRLTQLAFLLSFAAPAVAQTAAAPADGLSLAKVKPKRTAVKRGARVNLTGTGFDIGMKVTIGGQPCERLWVPDISEGKRAQCDVTGQATGKVDVVVTHGGKTATKAGALEFYEPTGVEVYLNKRLQSFAWIVLLLIVVIFVIARLPKVKDLPAGYTKAFLRRRVMNWLPLGLTYAFLYMGRYNLTVSKNALGDLMTKADFGTIFAAGTATYAISFVINGPLTDKYGGRLTILIASAGSAIMNAAMGVVTWMMLNGKFDPANLVVTFSALYAVNMYFQSFGAVSIVKVNASWFHVRERGVFGAIFGILISLGIYFAFDVGKMIVGAAEHSAVGTDPAAVWWVFFAPTVMLTIFHIVDQFLVRDTPGKAGHDDFDTADASSGDDGERMPVKQVFIMMFSNPVIVTIACIEFCSGFLRNAIMHWYIVFAKDTGIMGEFVPQNWGLLLCCAGILGGTFAGIISDRVFQSRRGPVAAILYGGMMFGAIGLTFLLTGPYVGMTVIFMSLCIIGVHGMLSGTASMDFGWKKNVGVAVGIIDGMVYLGTALQSVLYGQLLPKKGEGGEDPANWMVWPVAMIIVAAVGLALSTRVWKAKPKPKAAT